jgi:hypothetical protein
MVGDVMWAKKVKATKVFEDEGGDGVQVSVKGGRRW